MLRKEHTNCSEDAPVKIEDGCVKTVRTLQRFLLSISIFFLYYLKKCAHFYFKFSILFNSTLLYLTPDMIRTSSSFKIVFFPWFWRYHFSKWDSFIYLLFVDASTIQISLKLFNMFGCDTYTFIKPLIHVP